MFFFIIGRVSSTIKGLIVQPSLVDNDYTGEIIYITHYMDDILLAGQDEQKLLDIGR